jgi:hypothetical protein
VVGELDPRWEWLEVADLGVRETRLLRGRCRHIEVIPVEALDGQIVAGLCLTCDRQLPPTGR